MKEKGKLQLEWAFPPFPEFGISDTGFDELWTDPQMLYLRSRIQGRGGGAGGTFVCRECKLTFAKDISVL